jgi:hypothetical protein
MNIPTPTSGHLPDDAPTSTSQVTHLLPEDDFDLDAHLDWLMQEIDSGSQRIPADSHLQGPSISISLGDATDIDPELLIALCGPDLLAGPGNQALNKAFAQDHPADMLHPGPPDHRVHRPRRQPRGQKRTGIAIRNLVRQLRPLRSATIAINGAQQTFPPALSDGHRKILQALKDPGVTH